MVVLWLMAPVFVGFASPAGALGRSAHGAVRACATPQVRETVETNAASYVPGTPVVVTLRVHNLSGSPCSLGVGPSSPSFTVTTSSGAVLWSGCYVNDQPGACAMFLVATLLRAGGTFTKVVTWDGRSGLPARPVSTGTYRLRVGFIASHTLDIVVSRQVAPHTVTVGDSSSGTTLRLHVGDRLVVRLSTGSLYKWSEPVSSGPSVLARTGGRSTPSAVATFVARSLGTARVTAVGNPSCYPACLPPSRLYSLSVTVR